jgi:hypothetical protein
MTRALSVYFAIVCIQQCFLGEDRRRSKQISSSREQHQRWQSPLAAAATRETYKTLEIGTASDAHLVSSLLTKIIHSLGGGGGLFPWDDEFRQASAKIN